MRYRLLLISIASLSLSGFGSCSHTLVELCASRLPLYEKGFQEARLALRSAPGGRALASVTTGPRAASLEESERNRWMSWAEDQLKDAQAYIDASDGEPEFAPMRKELSKVADLLVSFHGYASRGDRDRMVKVLDDVLERGRGARALACESNSGEQDQALPANAIGAKTRE